MVDMMAWARNEFHMKRLDISIEQRIQFDDEWVEDPKMVWRVRWEDKGPFKTEFFDTIDDAVSFAKHLLIEKNFEDA